MDKVLTYTLRKEDMELTAGGLVNLVLKNCVKVTGHEISAAKFTPDGITCDGMLIHVSERMRPGQTLRVILPEEKDETRLIAVPGPVRILYEDEDLIAVDKLAGEVVHPGPGHYTDTVANHVTWYLQGGDVGDPPGTETQTLNRMSTIYTAPEKDGHNRMRQIGVPGEFLDSLTGEASGSEKADPLPQGEGLTGSVNWRTATVQKDYPAQTRRVAEGAGLRVIGRLDKETSGVLIFAKNRAAAARLQRQRREGTFARTYLAVCEGVFPEEEESVGEVAADGRSGNPEESSFSDDSAAVMPPNPPHKTGTIDLPMEKEPGVLMRMRIAKEGGLRAVTHYEVLGEWRSGDAVGFPLKERSSSPGSDEIIGQDNPGKVSSVQGILPASKDESTGSENHVQTQNDVGLDGWAGGWADEYGALTMPHSLLRVTIETGRTHQIRVHMAAIGHPLVGDTLYGSCADQNPDHVKSMPGAEAAGRCADHAAECSPGSYGTSEDRTSAGRTPSGRHALLHAYEVRLCQPFTGEPLHIISRIPFMNPQSPCRKDTATGIHHEQG